LRFILYSVKGIQSHISWGIAAENLNRIGSILKALDHFKLKFSIIFVL